MQNSGSECDSWHLRGSPGRLRVPWVPEDIPWASQGSPWSQRGFFGPLRGFSGPLRVSSVPLRRVLGKSGPGKSGPSSQPQKIGPLFLGAQSAVSPSNLGPWQIGLLVFIHVTHYTLYMYTHTIFKGLIETEGPSLLETASLLV